MNRISKLILFLLCNLLFSTNSFAQETIFTEEFFNKYEIVLLGEQTHGDGAVFEKKFKMIKELHEKGGFNLLVFESGMYDNFKANQLYKSKKESIAIFTQSVGYLYSTTVVFEQLLDYVEENPKLKILGFDSQESSLFEEYFLSDLKALCSKNNISISEETTEVLEKALIVGDMESYVGNKKDSTALYTKLNSLQDQIDLIPKDNLETKVLVQTFKSVFSDMDFTLKSLQKEKIHVQNPRDKQMAENLIFINERLPNEKIIGWGASFHFANKISDFEYTPETESYLEKAIKQTDSISSKNNTELQDRIDELKDLKFAKPMGQILKEKYGDALFSLAFTSYEGKYLDFYQNKEISILIPPTNSVETDLEKLGENNKLQLLKNYKDKFYTSALGYLPLYAEWKNIFDGIYYIEKMYPPVYKKYDAASESLLVKNISSSIEGTILDSETSKPISYADIYYADNNISTVSNSNGGFSIANLKVKNGYLVVSAIGYVSDSIQIKTLQKSNPILLKKSKDIVLNEVVVTAKLKVLSAEEIIQKAEKNIESNYVQTPYNQSFLFKIKDFVLKDSLNYGEEALIQTFNKKGINGSNNPENSFFGEIQHIRNNTDKYDKDKFRNGVGTLWVVLNRDILLSKTNVLHRTSSYDLTNEGTLNYEGRKVYKINFVNNSPGSYSTGYGYPAPEGSNGTIYIDAENFAVLKYEHCIQRAPFESKKSKNTIKYGHKIVQSYKNVNGKYFINLLEVTNTTNVYSPENEFLKNYIEVQQLVSQDIETKNVIVIKRPLTDLKEGFKKIESDPFWDDNPVDFKIKIQKEEKCF